MSSPHKLVLLAPLPCAVLAVVLVLHQLLLAAPLEHLGLGFAVHRGVIGLRVAGLAVHGVGDETQVALLGLLEPHRHHAWERESRGEESAW